MNALPTSHTSHIPLGIFCHNDTLFLYSNTAKDNDITFQLETSTDGFSFYPHKEQPKILDRNGKELSTRKITSFLVSKTKTRYTALFTYKPNMYTQTCIAFSDDGIVWQKFGQLKDITGPGFVVRSSTLPLPAYTLFFSDTSIHTALSKNLQKWDNIKQSTLPATTNFFGTQQRTIAYVQKLNNSLDIYYYNLLKKKHYTYYSLHKVLASKKYPHEVDWSSDICLWESPRGWLRRQVKPVGVVVTDAAVLSYWFVSNQMYVKSHTKQLQQTKQSREKLRSFQFLQKLEHNPILKPIIDHFWESKAVFNPAAIQDEDKVYIVYRAIGHDDVSTLGLAISHDGLTISDRLKEPIYIPTEPFETGTHTPYEKTGRYTSGGGCYGGCEDPRITKLDDTFYMTYVAYNGRHEPRVALTSISEEDFRNHSWDKWEKPVLISKPGEVNKNACIFPEKINGKYGIFHRVFPNILIDFVDSLDFDGNTFLKGEHRIEPREHTWDSRKVGAGPPPIRIKDGWLLIYQAVDDRYDKEYKIGAMILDDQDPTNVLYRPNRPILEPIEWYENHGFKSGVVYPCGAAVKDEDLYVYYGGADMYTCVARANLNTFVDEVKANEPAHLHLLN